MNNRFFLFHATRSPNGPAEMDPTRIQKIDEEEEEREKKKALYKQTGHFLCDAVQQNQNQRGEGTPIKLQNSLPVRAEEEEEEEQLLFIRGFWVRFWSKSQKVSSVKVCQTEEFLLFSQTLKVKGKFFKNKIIFL